ncbi:hypothetical protein [Sphingomonas abaci]|uniref:Uncharacterized protein n=1 Tax=Sphingomonas abaci TaxID=237611 RepID=A0A7W7APM7_9SPHN|nr:hypothetical protein [Sphingomonas abaci]MBB4619980.1 hypothetical protein [Sphingomonas abaci]
MTDATYTVTETAATSVARELKVGVRAKSGSSNPVKQTDWKDDVWPIMTFSLPVNATKATATISTKGNTVIDGDRDLEFYVISQSPTGGTVSMSPQYAKITDDDTVQPIVVTPYAYTDDLEDAAVGADPMARANWSAAGGGTAAYKVSSAKGLYNTGGNRGSAFALFGPDQNTDGTDFGYIVEYDENKSGTPTNGDNSGFNVAAFGLAMFFKDTTTWVRAKTNPSGIIPALERSYVSGADNFVSMTWRHALQTPPPDLTGAASVKTRWLYHDGRLRVVLPNGERCLRVDGSSTWPFDTGALSGVPGLANASDRRGKVGYLNTSFGYDFANGIRVTPLRMLSTEQTRYASRTTFTSGKGRISVGGRFRGTPTRWAYRVMAASNGATPMTLVQDIRDATDVKIDTTGTFAKFSYLADIPQGGPYIIETFMTDSDGVTSAAGSKRVGCGTYGIGIGQSNMVMRANDPVGKLTTFSRNVPSQPYLGSNTAGVPATEVTGFGTNEFTFSCNVETSRIIADATGFPCYFRSTGVPGSGLAFIASDSSFATTFGAARALIDGVVDFAAFDQGEGDRDGVDPPNSYYTTLKALYLKCVDNTGNPNLIFAISPIGRFSSTNPANSQTTWAKMDAHSRIIKLAYDQLIAEYPGKVMYADSKLGILHGTNDPYHYTPEGYMEMSRRLGRTIAKAMGKNVPDGRGPLPVGLSRSGATLTIDMDMNGAASLTDLIEKSTVSDNQRGTPVLSGALYGYEFSSDGFQTLLPITSIAPNAARNKLIAVLASDPGKPVQGRSYHGASYDDRYMFWGTGYSGGYEDVPVFPMPNTYLTSAN